MITLKSKRSQVGETLTWTVATIVILVIIFIFIFSVSTLSVKKKIVFGMGGYVEPEPSITQNQQMLFSILAYKPAELSGKSIGQAIAEERTKELAGQKYDYSKIDGITDKIFEAFEKEGKICGFGALVEIPGLVYKINFGSAHLSDPNADMAKIKDLRIQLTCKPLS
jgi:hypothetical protein